MSDTKTAPLGDFTDIGVWFEQAAPHVAVVEIQRPPNNFFDFELIRQIADAFDRLDAEKECRCIVLAAEGKAFCAGANFGGDGGGSERAAPITAGGESGGEEKSAFRRNAERLYYEAIRLFSGQKPVVGAIQGAAVGGGLGLALVPDLRVTCPEARFTANFSLLGFHPGFGLTYTLPALIGPSQANLMFFTGRRIKGEEAVEMGLADVLVPQDRVRQAAIELAREIAMAGPLANVAIRATLRQGLPEKIRAATERELAEQERLLATNDSKEGIRAVAERRPANFTAS